MIAEGNSARITVITTAGTAADTIANGGYWSGGFNKTQITDGVGSADACADKPGAVSAVVLSFTEGNVLPGNETYVIAKLTVDVVIPDPEGTAAFTYVNGCKGAGQPVNNNITQGGNTMIPTLGQKVIQLKPVVSCCDPPKGALNVGFSKAPVAKGTSALFEGVLGKGEQCFADAGSIETEVAPDAVGSAKAYVNIVSQLPDFTPDPLTPANLGGAQGWSFSIALTGDLKMAAATTAGTAAGPVDGGYWSGGFNKTQIVDPAKVVAGAPQGEGAVSAIVLSFTEGNTLPTDGTETVLELTVETKTPMPNVEGTVVSGDLVFQSGLVGAGQPVTNALTVGGNTEKACNFDTAKVAMVFKLEIPPVDKNFIRGNANNDLKVNIADPIWIINELFRGGPNSICADAADVNDDGNLDASDAVYLIDYLFVGGTAPPAPFPVCGTDPSGDADGVTCGEVGNGC
jgi:hypothetical protein